MQYLYIIKCQEFHKIGVANDVESRLAQLSTGNPYPLEVQTIYEFENAEPVERAIHQRYKSARQRGEWFTLGYDDLKNIHNICLSLGGSAYEYSGEQATNESIEEVEEIQENVFNGDKFDYAQMFADGWRMAEQGRGSKYWNWRRGSTNRETVYGGTIKSFPYPIEDMRRIYRDNVDGVPVTSEAK